MGTTKITVGKTLGHLKTIIVHKYWVYKYCRYLGIPWRGIKHDMSKFSPVEFWESVRYWTGTSSPILGCKEDKGYSLAWQHHKGRNSHHYEYWVDNLDNGGTAIKMPWNDLLELVADYLGAGRAYNGKGFTLKREYQWFRNKIQKDHPKFHPITQEMLDYMFYMFALDSSYLTYFAAVKDIWKKRYETETIETNTVR